MLKKINKDYLIMLKVERNYSDHTIRAYKNDLQQFNDFVECQECTKLKEIDRHIIRGYIVSMSTAGYANTTIRRKIACLRDLFNHLIFTRKLNLNPTDKIRTPKEKKKLPNFLTTQEMDRLLKAPDPTTIRGIRDIAIIETLYSTGVRVAELISININDIKFFQSEIKVMGKGSKERIVPIGSYAIKAIKKYMVALKKNKMCNFNDETPMFQTSRGERLAIRSVGKIFDRHVKTAKLNKLTSPKTMRHTCATHMLDNGAGIREIQELLGHESVSTTEVYLHMTTDQLIKVYGKSHPRK